MLTGLAALGSVAAILGAMVSGRAADDADEETDAGDIAGELRALRVEVADLKLTIEESSP
jgi:hypothetical protein